jgi:hypothetical protein
MAGQLAREKAEFPTMTAKVRAIAVTCLPLTTGTSHSAAGTSRPGGLHADVLECLAVTQTAAVAAVGGWPQVGHAARQPDVTGTSEPLEAEPSRAYPSEEATLVTVLLAGRADGSSQV